MASGSGARAAAAAGDQLARAHARLLHDPALQFAFASAPKPPPTPGWLKLVGQVLAAIAPLMQWVFWAGVAVGVIAIVVFIGRELIAVRWPGLKRKPAVLTAAPEWRPEPAKARALLEDADRLAAAGQYAEAAHLLLHRSIDDLEGRRPREVRPALTARDIAALASLPEAARADYPRPYESFALPEAWA